MAPENAPTGPLANAIPPPRNTPAGNPLAASLSIGILPTGNPAGGLDGLPEPSAAAGAPDRASIGRTRSLALISAAILGTAVVVGLPMLFRQQQQVAEMLSAAAGDAAAPAFARLAEAYWVLLIIIAGAGAGLAIAVLRMLRHAQSQAAVRREAQSMLLRAERARIDADQANADKSRFLAEAGHDLRTPLTTILGYGEMIERELLGPIGRVAYRQSAEYIVEAARQLTARIADIIELSRVEGSIARPAEFPTSVSSMVRETHGWAVTSFAAKRLTIGIRLPESPVGLKVQPLLLRRIVRGLITDAAARTPAGGAIILSVGFGGDGRLDVAVRDTGVTPAATTISTGDRSFDQRSIMLAQAEAGGDLGLMIVHALMQSIGGHMEVVDTAGRGSEIHLLFPRHLVVRDERRLRRRQLID
jgi:two-component system cell cycle sensor histidine kinase PleC